MGGGVDYERGTPVLVSVEGFMFAVKNECLQGYLARKKPPSPLGPP